MAALNEVRLIGNLTRDPEKRMTPSGKSVTKFGLAVNRKSSGREETLFIDVTCWEQVAEAVANYTEKGSQVFVGGRLTLETWDDKQSGQKRSKISVTAENVQFLDRKKERPSEPHERESWGDPAPKTDHDDEAMEPPF